MNTDQSSIETLANRKSREKNHTRQNLTSKIISSGCVSLRKKKMSIPTSKQGDSGSGSKKGATGSTKAFEMQRKSSLVY